MLGRIPLTHHVGVEISRQDAVEATDVDDGDGSSLDQRAHGSFGHAKAPRDLGYRQELCAHTSTTQVRAP